jgi:hypothetical protein
MIALDLMGKRNVNIKDWIKCDTDRCDKRLTMEKGTVAKKITIEKVPTLHCVGRTYSRETQNPRQRDGAKQR